MCIFFDLRTLVTRSYLQKPVKIDRLDVLQLHEKLTNGYIERRVSLIPLDTLAKFWLDDNAGKLFCRPVE